MCACVSLLGFFGLLMSRTASNNDPDISATMQRYHPNHLSVKEEVLLQDSHSVRPCSAHDHSAPSETQVSSVATNASKNSQRKLAEICKRKIGLETNTFYQAWMRKSKQCL